MEDDFDVDVGGEVRDYLSERELVVQDDALVLEGDEELEVVVGRVLEFHAEKFPQVLDLELVARTEVLSREARDRRLVWVDAEDEIDDVRLGLGLARRLRGARGRDAFRRLGPRRGRQSSL